MPIPKTDLGPHGEHLFADTEGNVAAEGDGPGDLKWGEFVPGDPDAPIRYEDWRHYYAMCVTAKARAETVAKLEKAAREKAEADAGE